LAALEAGDVRYFVDRFAAIDQWRILAHFLKVATFFDVETMGLEYDAPITVIVAWHRGELRSFVEHENLDDFLTVIDQTNLLVSFNGSSFDIPRLLGAFHIPALPCPHIDLRWTCYHRGLRGGLKLIAYQLGVTRPVDLQDADGLMAVSLWNRWMIDGDRAARDRLVRYCASDVLLAVMIAHWFAGREVDSLSVLWQQLPGAGGLHGSMADAPSSPREVRPAADCRILAKIRARRRGVA
jgi:uncharacterized protein YprB with RNaseH-like and TPR domain